MSAIAIRFSEYRVPSTKRQAPSAEYRAPSAERRAPSTERRAPSAEYRPLQQAFRRRQHRRHPPVARARGPQRSRERLEARLDMVVRRAAVEHLEVDVGPRPLREPVEEVVNQFRLEVADLADPQLEIDGRVNASAKIDRGD